MMYKYNYVFFWGPEDYYQFAFRDILSFENVRYIPGVLAGKNEFIKIIHALHNSSKINKLISLPFRKKWRDIYFENNFKEDKPIIFIFHGGYYWMKDLNYFAYLKNKYPNCKCVLHLTDTVESYRRCFVDKSYGNFDIEYVRKNFDYIVSYNMLDVRKYGLYYYPAIYSSKEREEIAERVNEYTDVFFVGLAKDRLSILINIYEQLTANGFTCDFNIIGVPETEQKYTDKIHYNKRMTYRETLEHIKKSKGILEIVQGGAEGFTLRLNEALVYDRNLITNNTIVNSIKYGASSKIFLLEEAGGLSKDEYDKNYKKSFEYNHEYSPIELLSFIEKLVEIKGTER